MFKTRIAQEELTASGVLFVIISMGAAAGEDANVPFLLLYNKSKKTQVW